MVQLGDRLMKIGFEGYEVYEVELDSIARSAGIRLQDRLLSFRDIHHILSNAFKDKGQIAVGPYQLTKGITEHGVYYPWRKLCETTEAGFSQLLLPFGKEDQNGRCNR